MIWLEPSPCNASLLKVLRAALLRRGNDVLESAATSSEVSATACAAVKAAS